MSDERDPSAPPTDEEIAASARLREALDEDPIVAALSAAWSPTALPAEAHEQLLADLPTKEELALAALVEEDEMVAALRAAWNPTALDAKEHDRIVDRALAGAIVQRNAGRSRLRVAVVTTTTVFALAAGVVLFLQTQAPPKATPEVALAKARSTQPLFGEPFHAGETSARIDRIAIARASDYRNNYFAKRGVK